VNQLRAALSPQSSVASSRNVSPGCAGEVAFAASLTANAHLFSPSSPLVDRNAAVAHFSPVPERAHAPNPTEFDFFNPGHGSLP
jgi:hypothetical protein